MKPRMGVAEHLNEAKLMIRETVKGAARYGRIYTARFRFAYEF